MSGSLEYASYLIRLWREVDQDPSVVRGSWHSEIEHIQTGEHRSFDTLEELLSFLRQAALDPTARSQEIV
ncbi:MAG: hypothetical protein JXC32_16700 [Anaerolineae bacterium]|nr:hypothetical protein [Anaerolineae bacterium]